MSIKDKTIQNREQILDIIRRATVCRVGLIVDGAPLILPMNFGFRDPYLYFHSSPKSVKLDQLRACPEVCVEMDIEHELQKGKLPCGWTMRFESVIGYGTAEILTDPEDKRVGLAAVMEQYGGTADGIPDKAVDGVAIIRIRLNQLTGRSNLTGPQASESAE